MKDLYSPSLLSPVPDPGVDVSLVTGGSPSLSPEADPFSEGQELRQSPQTRYGTALIVSLFIHLLILLLLLAVMHRPDHRPVKEVNHWIVNLVSALKEGPQGPRTVLPEESHVLAGPVRPGPQPERPLSAAAKTLPPDRFLDFQEPSPPPAVSGEHLSSGPFLPPREERKVEGVVLAMQESAHRQIQQGQFIFRMRMEDRMTGMKMKYFQQNAGTTVNALIDQTIPAEILKAFQGQSITLRILFREDGAFQKISLDSPAGEESLARMLSQKIPWETLASPRKFGLPFQELKVRVRIDPEGKPLSRISLV